MKKILNLCFLILSLFVFLAACRGNNQEIHQNTEKPSQEQGIILTPIEPEELDDESSEIDENDPTEESNVQVTESTEETIIEENNGNTYTPDFSNTIISEGQVDEV